MSVLRISLSDTFTLEFPLYELKTTFPKSLFMTILDLNASTDMIELKTPIVTQSILKYLHQVVTTRKLEHPPREEDLDTAAGYLNIDLLSVVADPKYDLLRRLYPDLDLLDVVYSRRALNFGIREKYQSLLNYILDHTEPEEDDTAYFIAACYTNNLSLIKRLLKDRGVNPYTATIDASWLNRILIPTQFPGIGDAKDNIFQSKTNHGLYFGLLQGSTDVITYLLKDERIKIDDPPMLAYATISSGSAVMLDMIMTKYGGDPEVCQCLFDRCLAYEDHMRLLLTYPQIHPIIREAKDVELIYPRAIELLCTHSEFSVLQTFRLMEEGIAHTDPYTIMSLFQKAYIRFMNNVPLSLMTEDVLGIATRMLSGPFRPYVSGHNKEIQKCVARFPSLVQLVQMILE